jgi:hypothetical protein
MRYRGLFILGFVMAILIALVVVVNSVIANAIAWANADTEAARLRALMEGVAWIAASGLLVVIALSFGMWLATGEMPWPLPLSPRTLARYLGGLSQLSPAQRRLALVLVVPSFLLLDAGLGVASWAVTSANITVWSSSPNVPTLLASLAGQIALVTAVAVFAWAQVLYLKWVFVRDRASSLNADGGGEASGPRPCT